MNTIPLLYTETTPIIILRFENKSRPDIDYISDVIQGNLYSFFRSVDTYEAINPNSFDKYVSVNSVTKGDLDNINTLITISQNFNAGLIITGNYFEKDNLLTVNFEVIDTVQKKIVYRISKTGQTGIRILKTIDAIAMQMAEDFTGIKIALGDLEVITEKPCTVYVDSFKMGLTPFEKKIPTGQHLLVVKYEDENESYFISKDKIDIEKDRVTSITLNVFYTATVNAEKPSVVYLDDDKAGITPCELTLMTGRDYRLKVVYLKPGNEKDIIGEQKVYSKDGTDLEYYYPITGTINVHNEKGKTYARLDKEEERQAPCSFFGLMPGKHRLKLFITDERFNRKLYYYNRMIPISAGENKVVEFNPLDYKPYYWLALLPGASQLYNKEFKKGAIVLSLFFTTVTIVALSPAVDRLSYDLGYLSKIRILDNNEAAIREGYTQHDVDNALLANTILFYSFLGTGIAGTFITWLISLIDGLHTSYKKYTLLRRKDTKKAMINIRFDLRII